MEIINSGSVPVERVFEHLFPLRGLRQLVGGHGAVCFALARSIVTRDFYETLIRNIETIDATTRNHIAFIVFHGRSTGLVRAVGEGRNRRGYRRAIEGLAVSTNCSDIYVEDDITEIGFREGNIPASGDWKVDFDTEATDRIRSRSSVEQFLDVTPHSERATSVLVDMFGIPEADLPCLLFVDSENTNARCTVQLSTADPVKSLYHDVLAILSDEFTELTKYWKQRDDVALRRSQLSSAERLIHEYPSRLSSLEIELRDIDAMIEETEPAQDSLKLQSEIKSLYFELGNKSFEKKVQAASERATEIFSNYERLQFLKLVKDLELLEEAKSQYDKLPQPTDAIYPEYRHIAKSILRNRSRLGTFIADSRSMLLWRLERIKEPQRNREKREYIVLRKKELDLEIAAASETISKLDWDRIRDAEERMARARSALATRGYDKEVLEKEYPSAFAVIHTLHRLGRIGTHEGRKQLASGSIRILLLAANPQNTTPLDLEEEIRAIQAELRGVKFRDQIEFMAQHAVRPDDLVRYVRTNRPTVIHFSGHGSSSGIALRDDAGRFHTVSGPALRRFFEDRGVKVVVLNSCFSEEQAAAVKDVVDFVVGTEQELGDEAARRFSVAFYRALGDGHSLGDAFRDGGDAVALYGLQDVFRVFGNLSLKLTD